MYYSIMPIDENTDVDIEYKEIYYKDKLMLVRCVEGSYTLERLFSTNPSDYLNPELQPGAILQNPLINN